MSGLLAERWHGFLERVMPAEAGEDQVVDMRRAFYAGAHAVMSVLINNLSEDEDNPDDEELTKAVMEEIEDFMSDVAGGDA